jgi:hypothetical protein
MLSASIQNSGVIPMAFESKWLDWRKRDSKEEEEEVKRLFIYGQRTDKTDKTPSEQQTLNGHQVARIIWETEKAVIFADEHGRFWRYLHAYGQAWPVVIDGGKS